MLRKTAMLLAALLLVCLPAGQCAEIDLAPTVPPEKAPGLPPVSQGALLEGVPINLNCAAAMLLEQDTGQIIFEMNADAPRPAASVTKVMTILLTLEMLDSGRLSPETVITVSEDASGMGGSQILLDTGERQSVSDLLKSVIVGSANDAAVALAETMYGSEAICAEHMNRRARELGMANTRFVNCTGLPAEGQHTTARDIAIMSREMFSHPLYYEYAGIWLEEFDHGDGRITQLTNTNKLIRLYDGCDGGKTGSTKEAGYCVSATAKRGDMRLVAVVMGAPDSAERFTAVREMFDYGFANYRLYPVAQRGARIRGALPVTGGDVPDVALMLDGDLTLLVLKGTEQDITLSPDLPGALSAPVEAGQRVGSVRVITDGRAVAEIPVVTLEGARAKGFLPTLKRLLAQWLDPSDGAA